jgi:hypothetical protein
MERERERKAKGKARTGQFQPQYGQTSHGGLSLSQPVRDGSQPVRTVGGQSWAERVRADLERKSKLAAHAAGRTGAATGVNVSGAASGSGLGGDVGGMRPSDEAEYARFVVKWEPVPDWLGISVPREPGDELDLQVVRPLDSVTLTTVRTVVAFIGCLCIELCKHISHSRTQAFRRDCSRLACTSPRR